MNTSATPRPAPYFVNPFFDAFFVGGLSLLVFAYAELFLPAGHSDVASRWAAVLMWGINWPHFSATLYRLYHRRENIAQFPATAGPVTALVFVGIAGALLSPSLVAPYFIKLFLLWSPYHFSGQTIGITLIYARRHGVDFGKWPRRFLTWFVFGTYAASTLRSEAGTVGVAYYGIIPPNLNVPASFASLFVVAMWLAGAAFLAYAIVWSVRSRRLFPLFVLLPPLAQFCWFVAGTNRQVFYVFVPLFHSLQYLPIAWAMQLGEASQSRSGGGTWAWLVTARWAAINFAGGIGLFLLFPALLVLLGFPRDFAMGVAIAGVQIHHFFVDGVIWKLRNEGTVRPLFASALAHFQNAGSRQAREAA